MYVCLAVTCHLHFWRNDRDRLRATAERKGRNRYRNKSQHRKLSLIFFFFFFSLPPLLRGLEPGTFRSRVRRSNHWAVPLRLYPLALAWDVNGRLDRFTRDSPPCAVVPQYQQLPISSHNPFNLRFDSSNGLIAFRVYQLSVYVRVVEINSDRPWQATHWNLHLPVPVNILVWVAFSFTTGLFYWIITQKGPPSFNYGWVLWNLWNYTFHR